MAREDALRVTAISPMQIRCGTMRVFRQPGQKVARWGVAIEYLREDKPMGMFRMGISEQSAEVLASLSFAQTVRLAASNQLLCRFRFDDHAILSALADKGKTALTHSAIVMAGQNVEQIG